MSAYQKQADREFPVLTAAVVAVCLVIFIALNSGRVNTVADAAKFGFLTDEAIYGGKYWGLVTAAFVHKEFLHLAFNLYWFWILGSIFERRFGIPWFAAFIFGSAVMSQGAELALGETGIGLSGVGYALFGFSWMARTRISEYARAMPNQMVVFFIGWGVFCLVMTQLGQMHVANLAHAGGLVFGAAFGLLYATDKHRPLIGASLGVLFAASLVPLFWNPMSDAWVVSKATQALMGGDLVKATGLFKRSLELGGDPTRAWMGLAFAYGEQKQEASYADAVNHLGQINQDAAKSVIDLYGEPK